MEGLIVMGLCFVLLAFVWVIYLAPKASRARQDEYLRRLRDLDAARDDDSTEESETETGQHE